MSTRLIIETALYFLALINPTSKVVLLSSMQPPCTGRQLVSVSVRATAVAFLILLVLSAGGRFLLQTVFRIDIYSLKVAGGIILFTIGLMAVSTGVFFEKDPEAPVSDLSVVPLGAPLIAGPGTITAAISFSLQNGLPLTMAAIVAALLVNLAIMLMSGGIHRALERIHATGPLIRITGLIVAAVAVQMVLAGLGEWMQGVFAGHKI